MQRSDGRSFRTESQEDHCNTVGLCSVISTTNGTIIFVLNQIHVENQVSVYNSHRQYAKYAATDPHGAPIHTASV
jgi:hypothetical protein